MLNKITVNRFFKISYSEKFHKCTQVERIVYMWSKSDRERQISCDITYMWNLKKNDTNELIYETETESQT